jgi:hypothetical protein
MFERHRIFAILAGAAGGAIAIASMEALSATTAFPLVAIPFATSIVMVLGSPKAEPAQPRALIGGHVISTFVSLLVVRLCGPAPWAAALAVAWQWSPCISPVRSSAGRNRPAGGGRKQYVVDLLDRQLASVQFCSLCSLSPGTI